MENVEGRKAEGRDRFWRYGGVRCIEVSLSIHASKHLSSKLELFPGVCMFLQSLFAEKIILSSPLPAPLFCIQTGFLSGLIMEETFIGIVQLLIKPPRKSLEEGEKLFRTKYQPENTADISRLHLWFPCEMTSEKMWRQIWVVLLIGWSKFQLIRNIA